MTRRTHLAEGVVAWYRPRSGFGMLVTDAYAERVFVHASDIDSDEENPKLPAGAHVRFDLVITPRGARAERVRVVRPPEHPRTADSPDHRAGGPARHSG